MKQGKDKIFNFFIYFLIPLNLFRIAIDILEQ